ncbi:hypothetical protein MHBO_002002 [Bonamia ostreae]|uniref:Uncharacterized protein n=1 Tax=Bonamia ostreae TaxID=126728 RepID=A0ABV2ALF9_9EUKA
MSNIAVRPICEESHLFAKKSLLLKEGISIIGTPSPKTNSAFLGGVHKETMLKQVNVRREYIAAECLNLRREMSNATEEVKRIQSVPLAVGQFGEMIDSERALIHANSGQTYLSRVLSTIPRERLKTNAPVALHRHSSAVVKVLEPHVDAAVSAVTITKRPEVTFADVGGLDAQKQEVREAVELPLTHAELYRSVGIEAPRGVLLYGPPGTGKTMMAKAVANSAKATFISVVGSEFVQKYIGEGARMVRSVFQMAKENSENGAIIFIEFPT